MKTFKFEVTMQVADCWIEDGFGATSLKGQKDIEDTIAEVIKGNMLTFAYDHEFVVKVKTAKAPPLKEIAALQGY